MSYRISGQCYNCGVCASQCPSGAIKEGNPTYVIDLGKCTNCGNCVSICPSCAVIEAKTDG